MLGEGAYDGVIAGRVTAGGAPRAGIKVSLLHSYDLVQGRPRLRYHRRSGAYIFNGLPAGNYHARFDKSACLPPSFILMQDQPQPCAPSAIGARGTGAPRRCRTSSRWRHSGAHRARQHAAVGGSRSLLWYIAQVRVVYVEQATATSGGRRRRNVPSGRPPQ